MLFGDRMSEPIADLDNSSHIRDNENLMIELLVEMALRCRRPRR